MPANTLVIRADASVANGLGHVMRCLAIAQAWQDSGGDVVYVMAESTDAVDLRLQAEGMAQLHLEGAPGSMADVRGLVENARSVLADWVVLDGYHFGEEYQRSLRTSGLRVLTIDDRNTCVHSCADIVLNPDVVLEPDVSPSSEQKKRESGAELLSGPKYALLRREFLSGNFVPRPGSDDRLRLLVTMGGSDPENISLRVIEALHELEPHELDIAVLVGGSNPHFESLEKMTKKFDRGLKLVKDPDDVPQWMAWADVAVTVAGNSVWELLFMGCGVLCYLRNAHDGRLMAGLEGQDAIVDLGLTTSMQNERLRQGLEQLSKRDVREAFAKNARNLVDGQGARRIVEKLLSQVPAEKRASL